MTLRNTCLWHWSKILKVSGGYLTIFVCLLFWCFWSLHVSQILWIFTEFECLCLKIWVSFFQDTQTRPFPLWCLNIQSNQSQADESNSIWTVDHTRKIVFHFACEYVGILTFHQTTVAVCMFLAMTHPLYPTISTSLTDDTTTTKQKTIADKQR